MGLTKVTATISDLAKKRQPYEDIIPADTGAIDCHAPARKLNKASIRPEGRSVYELADGIPVASDNLLQDMAGS
jgi:hypothetical protein